METDVKQKKTTTKECESESRIEILMSFKNAIFVNGKNMANISFTQTRFKMRFGHRDLRTHLFLSSFLISDSILFCFNNFSETEVKKKKDKMMSLHKRGTRSKTALSFLYHCCFCTSLFISAVVYLVFFFAQLLLCNFFPLEISQPRFQFMLHCATRLKRMYLISYMQLFENAFIFLCAGEL